MKEAKKTWPEPVVVGVSEMRRNSADLINRVAYGGERVLIERHGKPVAALVPVELFELLAKAEEYKLIAEAALRQGMSQEDFRAGVGLPDGGDEGEG